MKDRKEPFFSAVMRYTKHFRPLNETIGVMTKSLAVAASVMTESLAVASSKSLAVAVWL